MAKLSRSPTTKSMLKNKEENQCCCWPLTIIYRRAQAVSFPRKATTLSGREERETWARAIALPCATDDHPPIFIILFSCNRLFSQSLLRDKGMEDSLGIDYIFKYILVGDTSVGKSSILSTYNQGSFTGANNPTMGVEFATKKINMDGHIIKLQIWDTAGQESFRTITRAYYKNAIGVILVYDITAPKTIEALESWLTEIQENSNQKVEIIIAGNKKDLSKNQDPVLPHGISRFKTYVTSAKTGLNVNKMFNELTASVLKKLRTGQIQADGTHGVKKGNHAKGTSLKSSQLVAQEATSSKCC